MVSFGTGSVNINVTHSFLLNNLPTQCGTFGVLLSLVLFYITYAARSFRILFCLLPCSRSVNLHLNPWTFNWLSFQLVFLVSVILQFIIVLFCSVYTLILIWCKTPGRQIS